MVPAIVSVRTFQFILHVWARVGIVAIDYATKYTTKMKAKFSYCDQIKFNEPVLKPGIPEKQRIANH